MRRIISLNKGMTIAELMIVVGIVALIFAALSSFLIVHINSFKTSETLISTQYEGQTGLNEISTIIMESSDIFKFALINNSNILEEHNIESTLNEISLKNNNEYIAFAYEEADGSFEYHIFEYQDKHIKYKVSKNYDLSNSIERKVIGKNIKLLKFKPYVNESLKSTKGLEVDLEVYKDDITLLVSSKAKYRNKK